MLYYICNDKLPCQLVGNEVFVLPKKQKGGKILKEKVLKLLKDNKSQFISGQEISHQLNVSRTAIWKYINALKEESYEIESVSRKGHKLISTPDILNYEEISEYLTTQYVGREIYYFDSIDSTNIKAKDLAYNNEADGTVVIAEEQNQGRGRLGRNWSSPKKMGIWMSIILKPQIEPQDAVKVTQVAAAAVWKAIAQMGIKTQIKWPNDIVLNGKKICGILTEMSGELNRLNYLVVGIGINTNTNKEDFPEEIRNMATSIKAETSKEMERKKLLASVLNNFEALYDQLINHSSIEEALIICKENSALIGKNVRLIIKGEVKEVEAMDINEDGELIVKDKEGNTSKVISGEVSVRGLYGYA